MMGDKGILQQIVMQKDARCVFLLQKHQFSGEKLWYLPINT